MQIAAHILEFLTELQANNHRTWFDENRKRYDLAKAEFELFVGELINRIGVYDKSIAGQEAKKCTFRIYKDVRFAKDKTPYKNNMGAYLVDGGKKSPKAGYYLHVQPGASFIAGGLWMPTTAMLRAARQEIAYNTGDFKNIVENPELKKIFGNFDAEELKKHPKEFLEFEDAQPYMRYKHFVLSKKFNDKEICNKNFINTLDNSYKQLFPLIQFLNTAISDVL